MSVRHPLKYLHLLGMFWFLTCLVYALALVLHQTGLKWWIIFSMSGHSAIIIILLVMLYLYVGFQGIAGERCYAIEHQLTFTNSYMFLYLSAPFLGGLAGFMNSFGFEMSLEQSLLGIALATMIGTFLIWIIVDPLVTFLETILVTESREHKAKRLAQAKIEKQQRQKAREQMIKEVLSKEKSAQRHWQEVLKEEVDKVVQLLTDSNVNPKQVESQIVKTGVKAWQTGGINCMKTLRDMAIQEYQRRNGTEMTNDYISCWWDGIGSWRTT